MTVKIHKYTTIICEGCGKVHGRPDEYPDAQAARSAALAAGWKLVPKLNSNGKPARIDLSNPKALTTIGRNAHDACPGCADGLEPAVRNDKRAGRSSWWSERIAELQAENDRLREEARRRA